MIQSGDTVRVTYISDLGSAHPLGRGSTMTCCTARFVGLDTRLDGSPFAEEDAVEVIALFDDHDGRIAIPIHLLEDVSPAQRPDGVQPTAIIHDDMPMFPRMRLEFDDEEGMGTEPEYGSLPGKIVAVLCVIALVLFVVSMFLSS